MLETSLSIGMIPSLKNSVMLILLLLIHETMEKVYNVNEFRYDIPLLEPYIYNCIT